jgi:ATP-binding cassette subfamily B protein
MAVAERLTRIIDNDATITDSPDAEPLLVLPKTISFSGVSIKNSRRHRVSRKWMLNDITCDIHHGERIAVMGTNGAGKSTLIKLLMRLSDPQRGSIEMDGKDIRLLTLDSLRNNISVVFQDSIFFGLTLRENIAFGKADATTEEIEQCIKRCGIDQWISGLKKGIDTPVKRQGAIFSGGEKQKIAIARALLRNGGIWLLDEPTNSLDEVSRENIIKLLLEVTNNRTTFWVTHDKSILEHFTRVLLIDEGNIAFLGTPKEFSSWLETNVDENRIFEQIVSGISQKEGE